MSQKKNNTDLACYLYNCDVHQPISIIFGRAGLSKRGALARFGLASTASAEREPIRGVWCGARSGSPGGTAPGGGSDQRWTWVGSIHGFGWVGSHFPAHVMGWVGLNEEYCGIVAEYCKTHTFHCP